MPPELLVYLNGELVEESKARVSPFDRGFMMGDGVYEITGCFNGNMYRLGDNVPDGDGLEIRFKLVEIRQRSVILDWEGRRFELKMESPRS